MDPYGTCAWIGCAGASEQRRRSVATRLLHRCIDDIKAAASYLCSTPRRPAPSLCAAGISSGVEFHAPRRFTSEGDTAAASLALRPIGDSAWPRCAPMMPRCSARIAAAFSHACGAPAAANLYAERDGRIADCCWGARARGVAPRAADRRG